MSSKPRLLFVYNADSGTFNALADMGHKLFSPQTYACSLCAITHGVFREKAQWQRFIMSLPIACDFQHRDEFREDNPDRQDTLPAIFWVHNEKITPCLSAEALESCSNMKDLETLILNHCIASLENMPI